MPYSEDMKFNGEEGGVENQFKQYYEQGGDHGDAWWQDEMDGASSNGTGGFGGFDPKKMGGKAVQSFGDFEDLKREIAKFVFGDRPDDLLIGINKFM